MRFHIGAAVYVITFMYAFYDLNVSQKAAIYICIGLVIGMELLNTAIESTCDLACNNQKDSRAKTAKDCAAAAVLIVSAAAVAVGIVVFWDTAVFGKIFRFFKENIMVFAAFIVSLMLWAAWILSTKGKDK